MRKFFRVIYYSVCILVFILIAVIGYTQTRAFKTYLRETILKESGKALNGELTFGFIKGNLLTGFSVDSISIRENNTELFSSNNIEFKYDLLGFLFKRIVVYDVVIVEPHINIYRTSEGVWNVARLVRPSPQDTNPSAWVVDIKTLKLQNAELLLTDSLRLSRRQSGFLETPSDTVIDYARVHFSALSLETSAEIKEGSYQINLKNLDFKSDKPSFLLKHLGGDFMLTKNEISVRNLNISTAKSRLALTAGLKNIDITTLSTLADLKHIPVNLNLTAENFNTKEFRQFLYPYVDFLDNDLKIQLEAHGTFGDLKIEKLAVQMPHSYVNIHGQLLNLDSPKNLEMNLQAVDNTVEPRDIAECLPGLSIPDLSAFGTLKYSFNYEGRPLDFKSHISCITDAGNFDIDGKMKIVPEEIRYNGTILLKSVALDTIFHNKKFSSNLNARMSIDGAGFDPRFMTGSVKMELDSSSLRGLSVRNTSFMLDIADGKLKSHVATTIGSSNYEISSFVRFISKDSSSYSIDAKIRSLNLAELFDEKRYGSSLSFDLAAGGAEGRTARSDTAKLSFYPSSFAQEEFESGEANIIFTLRDSLQSSLQVKSSIFDLDVNGQFSPVSFISAWENSYWLITDAVAYRFKSLDSLRSVNGTVASEEPFQPAHQLKNTTIESRFRLNIYEFEPFGLFIDIPMTGQGIIEGNVSGNSGSMQLDGKASFERFEVCAGTDTLAADSATIKFLLGGINGRTIFKTFNASLETDLKNFTINDFLFNRFSGQLNVKSDSSNFNLSAYIDSTAKVQVEGSSCVNARLMQFDIPELSVELGKYKAENSDNVRMVLGSDGFYIQSLAIAHGSEQASFSGYFSPTGISDLIVSVNKFLLADLKQVLFRGPYAMSSMQFDGTVGATASFRGSFKNPYIILDINGEGVRAEDSRQNISQDFGKIESHLAYSEHALTVLLRMINRPDNPQNAPDLLLSGSLPYEFVLTREIPHKLTGDVNLMLKANNLDLRFIDPFIPEISGLTGRFSCDMKMTGPFDNPQYEGSMSIQQASLVFEPLGIRYILNGDLIPAGDRIQFKNFTIKNDPEEPQHAGAMQITGNFTLQGFSLKHFDIVAQGDLKVMREDKRFTGQKIYGDLFAATGPNGLHWEGNLSKSKVRGDMFIKDAQLILPPERDVEFVSSNIVNVKFLNDTARAEHTVSKENSVAASKQKLQRANNKNEINSEIISSLYEQVNNSFLDGIEYDVNIETRGPTTLRFVFNTQTSNELFADLEGRVYFNKIPGQSRLTGQVDVSNRSYYNFIKRFEATGKILFTGDVLNPELDIAATYIGRHDTVNQSQVLGGCAGPEKAHQVLVTVLITGTRNEPKTKIILQTRVPPSKDWVEWPCGDEEGNAIAFVFSGQYKSELTDQQRTGIIGANFGSSLGSAIASGMFTGPLSDAIRKNFWSGFQSIDVSYYGGQFDQTADLRLTGQVGEAVIRAGGYVFTGEVSNLNYSVELPMSYVVGVDRLHNLILTLERRVESIQNFEEQRRASNGVRLFYRFTF